MEKESGKKNIIVNGVVRLPLSKSISNRLVVIAALGGWRINAEKISDCTDTQVIWDVVNSDKQEVNVGDAGTAMRFLTAFFASAKGEKLLTGSERMQERPIGGLVEALRQLGAEITYRGVVGYPPLFIKGSSLKGGKIVIDAGVSSQFISALMLVAPYMKEELVLKPDNKIVSSAYIKLTASLMEQFGAKVIFEKETIKVARFPYIFRDYSVEGDWSAASYFYELLAVADQGEIEIGGLRPDSMQGDYRQVEIWEKLGVRTEFKENGIILKKSALQASSFEYDFVEMPDLIQTFVVACCLKSIPFVISGTDTLRKKETDRIEALQRELKKIGFQIEVNDKDHLIWNGNKTEFSSCEIETYGDHRMAMAFAPATLLSSGVIIKNPGVVNKSFPHFWEEWGKLIH